MESIVAGGTEKRTIYFGETPYGNIMNALPPSSNHPGGVNVVFADGSVKFIKDTLAIQTWWALGTRNGGEIVSADQY
jgi:prepilin-type processing-associated H-X9-DG protein